MMKLPLKLGGKKRKAYVQLIAPSWPRHVQFTAW